MHHFRMFKAGIINYFMKGGTLMVMDNELWFPSVAPLRFQLL